MLVRLLARFQQLLDHPELSIRAAKIDFKQVRRPAWRLCVAVASAHRVAAHAPVCHLRQGAEVLLVYAQGQRAPPQPAADALQHYS